MRSRPSKPSLAIQERLVVKMLLFSVWLALKLNRGRKANKKCYDRAGLERKYLWLQEKEGEQAVADSSWLLR